VKDQDNIEDSTEMEDSAEEKEKKIDDLLTSLGNFDKKTD
jgi:hypothetical protein